MSSSCLYVGNTQHRRFTPVNHHFNYKVLYFFLDLDEIPQIFKYPFLFSYNFPGILSFWRKDYFGDKENSIKSSIEKFIFEKTGSVFSGKIKILTNISYFGFCFNPVSFYYCYGNDHKLEFIVSEITNTPWGEKHAQVFVTNHAKEIYTFPKDFHVSPFMPMNMMYTWYFYAPDEKLKVLMQNRDEKGETLVFDSLLNLSKIPLNWKMITKYSVLIPLASLKTFFGIYYQAMCLFLKKVPFYTHPLKEKRYDNSRTS
jgi:DUF1365 family protein